MFSGLYKYARAPQLFWIMSMALEITARIKESSGDSLGILGSSWDSRIILTKIQSCRSLGPTQPLQRVVYMDGSSKILNAVT